MQSVTLTHSTNEKKKKANSDALVRSLAKSVFSIDTGTSKVTEDDTEDDMKSSDDEDSSKISNNDTKAMGIEVAIEGMGVLAGNTGRQSEAASEEDKDAVMKDQDKSHEDEFSSVGADLSRCMEKASEELTDSLVSDEEGYITPIDPLSSNKGGESYKEDDSTGQPGNEEFDAVSYNSSATEVDLGVYQAIHGQKYVTPKNSANNSGTIGDHPSNQ